MWALFNIICYIIITSKLIHTHTQIYAIENTKKLHSQNKQLFYSSTVLTGNVLKSEEAVRERESVTGLGLQHPLYQGTKGLGERLTVSSVFAVGVVQRRQLINAVSPLVNSALLKRVGMTG